MNFFNKSKNASAGTDASATSIPSDPSIPAIPSETTPPAMLPPSDIPAPSAAPEAAADDVSKKSRFARFKKPQLPVFRGARKPAASDATPDDVAADVAALQVSAPPPAVDPAKAARRAARRAERTRLENEWAEKDHKRRYQAALSGLEMDPLEPLPDFDSASEDDREPEQVAGHPPTDPPPPHHASASPPDAVVAEGVSATVQPTQPAMAGPYMPANPDTYDDPMDRPAAPHPHPFPGQHPAPTSPHPAVPVQQQPPRRNPAADVQMAEMFGAQAYTGTTGYHAPAAAPPAMAGRAYGTEGVPQPRMHPHASHPPPQYHQHAPPGAPRPAANPAPIGWGDVYNVPSQPMFGAPMHTSGSMRAALDIDPVLADRIRRGRELARLAIEQEEQGNLGAAENGYMKALELLVPVSKELDVGSDLDKNVRMHQKAKIQREAAAMLDRCEEIRLFLKANGPAVPNEMPSVPIVKPTARRTSAAKKKDDGTARPPDLDADLSSSEPSRSSTAELSRPKPVEPKTVDSGPPNRPPPPPPPSFDGDSGDLLERITCRRNVLSAASAGIHAAGGAPASSAPKPRVEGEVAKCFVCNAPADLKAKCGHTFCTKCGNQAANVFRTCPDRSCNAPLTSGAFENIM